MPFYKMLEGQPSNSMHIQTLEDVPSAPPDNINIEMVNMSSAILSLSPPPPQHRNGYLLGYNVQVKTNSSIIHSNLVLNATTTHITLGNNNHNCYTCVPCNQLHPLPLHCIQILPQCNMVLLTGASKMHIWRYFWGASLGLQIKLCWDWNALFGFFTQWSIVQEPFMGSKL